METRFEVPEGRPEKATATQASIRVIISLIVGIIVAIVIGTTWGWEFAPLAGWDSASVVLLAWILGSIRTHDAQATADHAVREDAGRTVTDILLLIASLGSLVAVGVLFSQTLKPGNIELTQVAFGLVSVLLSWAVIHTIFTLRYARLYYTAKGGVDFNDKEPPNYTDFAYLAFTLGMTYQVSDTSFMSTAMRRLALGHALLSYLFGTVIIASTINVVISLTQSQ